MRTRLLTLAVLYSCTTLASASNMGFVLHGDRPIALDPWLECERASRVAEVRVPGMEAATEPEVRGDLVLHASQATALLSVRRTWKGVPRAQLSAETPMWGLEGGPQVLRPGMRAVVFLARDEVSGWRVTHWLRAPDGGEERRELRLLMEEAVRLQAAATVEPRAVHEWRLRAWEHPSFGLAAP